MAKVKQTMIKQKPNCILENIDISEDIIPDLVITTDTKVYSVNTVVTKTIVEELNIMLHAHKPTIIEHKGTISIENIIGGDVLVNDSILYTGDVIKITDRAVLLSECYPKVKITKYR